MPSFVLVPDFQCLFRDMDATQCSQFQVWFKVSRKNVHVSHTRILKRGVWHSLFTKSRSPTLSIPAPPPPPPPPPQKKKKKKKNRSPISSSWLSSFIVFQLNSVPHFDAQTDISQRDKVLFCLGCLFSSFNRKRWAFVFEVSDENLVSENFEMEKTSINKNNNNKKKKKGTASLRDERSWHLHVHFQWICWSVEAIHNEGVSHMYLLLNQLTIPEVLTANTCLTTACFASS